MLLDQGITISLVGVVGGLRRFEAKPSRRTFVELSFITQRHEPSRQSGMTRVTDSSG
jgi:hypothetical protein